MSSRKFGINLVVVMAIAALFTGFWALINRPVSAPDWPEQISGFSYSPFRLGESPQKGQYPTEAELREDLEQLSKVWPLAAIADPMLGGAAASLWLAPLDGDEYRAERAALSAWLQRHGSWDRTARDLDLHRNTVRRLVASAGERLGRDQAVELLAGQTGKRGDDLLGRLGEQRRSAIARGGLKPMADIRPGRKGGAP